MRPRLNDIHKEIINKSLSADSASKKPEAFVRLRSQQTSCDGVVASVPVEDELIDLHVERKGRVTGRRGRASDGEVDAVAVV